MIIDFFFKMNDESSFVITKGFENALSSFITKGFENALLTTTYNDDLVSTTVQSSYHHVDHKLLLINIIKKFLSTTKSAIFVCNKDGVLEYIKIDGDHFDLKKTTKGGKGKKTLMRHKKRKTVKQSKTKGRKYGGGKYKALAQAIANDLETFAHFMNNNQDNPLKVIIFGMFILLRWILLCISMEVIMVYVLPYISNDQVRPQNYEVTYFLKHTVEALLYLRNYYHQHVNIAAAPVRNDNVIAEVPLQDYEDGISDISDSEKNSVDAIIRTENNGDVRHKVIITHSQTTSKGLRNAFINLVKCFNNKQIGDNRGLEIREPETFPTTRTSRFKIPNIFGPKKNKY